MDIDSYVYVEYGGASFKKDIDHKQSYDHFYALAIIIL
jgi:hypothetical protein